MARKHPLTVFRESHKPRLSQTDLAKKLGVTKATICRWEKHDRFPDRDLWPRIKRLTGISADDFAASEAA